MRLVDVEKGEDFLDCRTYNMQFVAVIYHVIYLLSHSGPSVATF
jgi:hypothetical protein